MTIRRPSGAIVLVKSGWFWTALHYIVMAITFGGNRRFLTGYWTTLGRYIAAPVGTDITHPAHEPVLAHEEIHVGQFRKFGLGLPELGIIPMGIAYLFLPLPIGLAWCRWAFERVAYAEGIRAAVKLGRSRERLIDSAVRQMTTGAYGWTWPFSGAVRRWFEAHT